MEKYLHGINETVSYTYNSTTGNLASKGGVSYTYGAQSASCPDGALSKPHGGVTAGSNTYCYDKNGNQVKRTIGGSAYTLSYDAENRLTGVSGAATATFVYDGDGKRVKATAGGVTTAYVGDYFEWSGSTSTMVKYYYAGTTRVAMRVGSNNPKWLLSDHLGSQSIVASYDGLTEEGELRYKAWGETRYTSGTTPTKRQYTGQLSEMASIGLYFYGARFYDPALSRFTSADSIIPGAGDVQAWDRYAAMLNNTLKYVDPTGHRSDAVMHDSDGDAECNDPNHCLDASGNLKKAGYATEDVPSASKEDKPDAHLLSFTYQIGMGGWYIVGGFDIVNNDTQVGYFSTSSYGPANDCDMGRCQINSDLNFLTPQFGISFLEGEVNGGDISEDVTSYEGYSMIGGITAGSITYEKFTSIDIMTSRVDNRVHGWAAGISFGLPDLEGHVNYTRATYDNIKSENLSNIARLFGLIP